MNTIFLNLVLVSLLVVAIYAAPEPALAKGRGGAYYNEPANPKYRSPGPVDKDDQFIAEFPQAAEDDGDGSDNSSDNTASKADVSSSRMFFSYIFGGSSNTYPSVIPIYTSSGTITATPLGTSSGTITATPLRRSSDEYMNEEEGRDPAAMIDEQALNEALAYVVTDEAIKATSDNKPSQAPNRKGVRKGQVIRVRMPSQYRRYFQNGQRVMLNQAGKRRVIKRRVNKNNNRRRLNRNRNKKNRFVAV